MNNEYEKQLNTLKDIKLSTIEKTEMRDSLVHFIAAHPYVQASPVLRFFTREKFILSPYSGISMHITKVLAFSFIGLLFTGGSLTMASASSIPGEILYPIKINIQEPIEGAGKTKPAEKLEWQTKKLGRRLTEIQKLSEKKDITKEEVVIAQAVLQEHVKDLTDTINTLKEDGTTGGLILSGSAELLSLSETLSTTQGVSIDAVTTDTTTDTDGTTSTQQTDTTNTVDTTSTHTTTTKTETADISTITDMTGQKELKDILSHEVDKQIIDIKKTVETVAQDTEKTDVSDTEAQTDTDQKVTTEKKDTLPETLIQQERDTLHNTVGASLTQQTVLSRTKGEERKNDSIYTIIKKTVTPNKQ